MLVIAQMEKLIMLHRLHFLVVSLQCRCTQKGVKKLIKRLGFNSMTKQAIIQESAFEKFARRERESELKPFLKEFQQESRGAESVTIGL